MKCHLYMQHSLLPSAFPYALLSASQKVHNNRLRHYAFLIDDVSFFVLFFARQEDDQFALVSILSHFTIWKAELLPHTLNAAHDREIWDGLTESDAPF